MDRDLGGPHRGLLCGQGEQPDHADERAGPPDGLEPALRLLEGRLTRRPRGAAGTGPRQSGVEGGGRGQLEVMETGGHRDREGSASGHRSHQGGGFPMIAKPDPHAAISDRLAHSATGERPGNFTFGPGVDIDR